MSIAIYRWWNDQSFQVTRCSRCAVICGVVAHDPEMVKGGLGIVLDFTPPAGIGGYRVEAVVRYHLLDERRRRRIGYDNPEPIAYEVFRERLALN